MRKLTLVVNADDAGIDVPRNDGIFAAHTRGIVTSATVMVTGPGFEDFVRRSRSHPKLGVGVHLNLSECCPPASPAGVPGAFVEKHLLWGRASAGELDLRLLELELRAQLERAIAAGLRPTHIDGHNHIHAFPCVAEVLDRLEREFPFVARRRHPFEFEGVPDPCDKARRFASLVATRRRPIGPAAFAGFCLEGRWSIERLLAVLTACTAASLELMVHPGCAAEGSVPFSAAAERAVEVAVLTDPRVITWIADHSVELTTYAAFPWAR